MLNRELLNKHIERKNKTITQLAEDIGITREALYKKLKPLDEGGTEFKASEIKKIISSLNLTMRETKSIFFE